MEKIVALVILAVLSLLTPLLEIVVTGRIEPFGKFYQVNMFLSVGAVYWCSNSHYDINPLKWQTDSTMRPVYERPLWKKCLNL